MAATQRVRARDDAQRSRRMALVKICLRLLVSAALLAFLVTKIPAGSVEPKDTHAGTLTFFFAALALTFGGFVLSAWRWQRVLAVFDVEIGLRTFCRTTSRPVRREHAAVDDRRRRPAREPIVEDRRR
jgi:hypothetical protein